MHLCLRVGTQSTTPVAYQLVVQHCIQQGRCVWLKIPLWPFVHTTLLVSTAAGGSVQAAPKCRQRATNLQAVCGVTAVSWRSWNGTIRSCAAAACKQYCVGAIIPFVSCSNNSDTGTTSIPSNKVVIPLKASYQARIQCIVTLGLRALQSQQNTRAHTGFFVTHLTKAQKPCASTDICTALVQHQQQHDLLDNTNNNCSTCWLDHPAQVVLPKGSLSPNT